MKKIIVIGNGKMAVDCIKSLLTRSTVELPLIVHGPGDTAPAAQISRFAANHGIDSLEAGNPNRARVLSRVRGIGPDIIFNINSFRILKPELLAIPKLGTVNFHNGPLPRLGGVNIPSWAIIEGGREHGVTWHFVDDGIDTGPILAQRCFELAERETALSLTFRCIAEGTAMFDEVLDGLLAGTLKGQTQTGKSSYYSPKDIPNQGYIDFGWDFDRLDRFVRGLDFRPFPNTFTYAKIRFQESEFIVNSLSRVIPAGGTADPGTIIAAGEGRLHVAIRDGTASIDEAMDDHEEEIEIVPLIGRYGLRVGDRLGR